MDELRARVDTDALLVDADVSHARP